MRLVLDTNVLLAALLAPTGAPARLLELWEEDEFTLVSCEELVSEFLAVASRSFFTKRLRASDVARVAAGLRERADWMETLPETPAAPDPKDTFLLALAQGSQAEFLVTGDKLLQSLGHHRNTRIVTPSGVLLELANITKA